MLVDRAVMSSYQTTLEIERTINRQIDRWMDRWYTCREVSNNNLLCSKAYWAL